MQTNPAKANWRDQIHRSLARSNFPEAITLVHQALEEFPDDPDLLTLEEQVIHRRERCVQAYQLMEEGRQLCERQNFEDGIQALREAYSLDELNSAARSALVDNLLCYALAVQGTNLPLAEQLTQEAAGLDPANLVTRSVTRSIQEQKQDALLGKNVSGNGKVVDDFKPPEAQRAKVEALAQAAPTPKIGEDSKTTKSSTPLPGPAKLSPGTSVDAAKPSVSRAVVPAAHAPLGEQEPPVRPPVPELTATAAFPAAVEPKAAPPGNAPVRERPTPAAPSPTLPHAKTTVKPTPAPLRPAMPRPVAARGRRSALPFPKRVWVACGLAVLLVGAGLILLAIRQHGATADPVLVAIHTSPSGAAVRINGELRDIEQHVSLVPGRYRIEALLDGYQTAVQDIVITPAFREPVELTLLPFVQALRVSTDLATGVVFLDGQRMGELQNGQFALDTLADGNHVLRVTSGSQIETVIPFQVGLQEPPLLAGAITEKNLRVVLVSNYQNRGRVYTGSDPISVQLDGQAIGKVSKGGDLELAGLTAASHDFVLGEGKEQRKISLDVGAGSSLFVSLSSDRNVGTLEIATNEDGFQVLLNGKPARVTRQRGRYYIYNVDAASASVQISKPGFDSDPAEQKVVVRKGATARLAFKLTPAPTTATLHLLGALPGTHVSIDGTPHELLADGSLSTTVSEGDHTIGLTREGYQMKSLRISARAGQTVTLGAPELAVDSPNTGKLTITARSPANARVVLQRGESEIPIGGREAEVPEGDYTLLATAPGFRDLSQPVHISEPLPASAAVVLVAIPQIVRMEGWDDPQGWRLENGWYQRKGGSFVLFKPSARNGTYEFTARHKSRQLPFFGGGQIRWVLNYNKEPQDYDLYEIDGDKLSWKRIIDGKQGAQRQARHGVKIKDETYRLILEVGSGQFTGKLYDGQTWKTLPQLEVGALNTDGRFGFYLPNNDEMWLTDFVFKPKE